MPKDVRRELDKLAQRHNNIAPREMEQAAKDADWTWRRTTGSHAIYKKDGVQQPLAIPLHPGALDGRLAKRLIRQIKDSL